MEKRSKNPSIEVAVPPLKIHVLKYQSQLWP